MKKKVIYLILLLSFSFLLLCSCNSENSTDSVTFNGDVYTICDYDWHPFGQESRAGEFILFENDKDNLFIKTPTFLFSEGVIYHKEGDTYPSVANTESIEKITLDNGKEEIDVSPIYAEQFKKLLQFENISESLLEEVDHSEKSSFLFVNVYYRDYPAYQNKWMLVKIQNNVWGIQFCETSENSKMLGENNALRITSSEINEYLNHLV